MKKITSCIALMLSILILTPYQAYAEDKTEDKLEVKLFSGYFETEYNVNDVDVEYSQNENTIKAIVRDKETGDELSAYKETTDLPISQVKSLTSNNKNRSIRTISTYDTTLSVNKTIISNPKTIKAYTTARVEVSNDFNWCQINRVYSYDHCAGGGGTYRLVNTHNYLGTRKFPATSIKIDIDGVSEVDSIVGLEASAAYEKCGWNVGLSGNVQGHYYARKPYNTSVKFRVM